MFPFPEGKEYLNLIPIDSMEEFYMPLYAFDFSKDSKNGCGGSKSETVLKFHLITNIQTMFIFFNIRFNGFVRGDCYTWWCWHPVDFPSNQQFTAHFLEFLRFGYKAGLGSVQCKVPSPRREQKGEGWHSRSGGRIGQDCDSLLNSGVFHWAGDLPRNGQSGPGAITNHGINDGNPVHLSQVWQSSPSLPP